MTKSMKALFVGAALTGVMSGITAVAQPSKSNLATSMSKGEESGGNPARNRHSCKGRNSCKTRGGCGATKGKNDCKGKGECRTDGRRMSRSMRQGMSK